MISLLRSTLKHLAAIVGISFLLMAPMQSINLPLASAASPESYPWSDAAHVSMPPASDNITWGYTDKATCDSKFTLGCRTYKEGDYYVLDPWGYYFRNCTSYVSWRVNVEYGADASGLGNAKDWSAGAKGKGWSLEATPAVGDLAQWVSGGGGYGHIGYVEEVLPQANGTTKARISEYNQDFNGNLRTDRVVTAENYIRIPHTGSGQNTGDVAGSPSVVSRSSTSMDTLTRTTSNGLRDRWWDASVGWATTNIPNVTGGNAAAGDPKIISRTSSSMDVFYRNANNQLTTAWWDTSHGWNIFVIPGAPAMSGDPSPVTRSATSMDVLYKAANGQLVDAWWDPSAGGWHYSIIYGTPVVSSNPSAVSRTQTSMDVIFRAADNQLVDAWWDASVGWHSNILPGTTGNNAARGNPSAKARNSTSMDVMYRSAIGQLVDEWWDSSVGWHTNVIYNTAPVSGDPFTVSRSVSSMDVFYRDTNNNLNDAWWDSSIGWNNQTLAANMSSEPAAVNRSSTSMDVLFRNSSNKLTDEWWDQSVGWNQTSL